MKFIDLYSGLGGFHIALKRLGHECVFASELDSDLALLYEKNFGITPAGDIRTVNLAEIPPHDILCAGFPCQPFSKAGDQQGLDCPQWGDLVDYVFHILRHHKPTYFIVENVPNLVRHNEGETWKEIKSELCDAGYDVADHKLSPHHFGVPQIRERAFIVGQRDGLATFRWPAPAQPAELSIRTVLEQDPRDARQLSEQAIRYLEAWQCFLDAFPSDEELPSFPIWAMEFGASYPYVGRTPHSTDYRGLDRWRGSFGRPLRGLPPDDVKAVLPPYARDRADVFPDWKIDFIRKNRTFYRRHKNVIDPWLPSILSFAPSFQKLEWNCKGCERDIWNLVIQFRASGIRVKRPTTAPSLVAMTTSQVPVIAWERRYMTPRECSHLQSMASLKHLPDAKGAAFKALGNAVNVDVVEAIARALLPASTSVPIEKGTRPKISHNWSALQPADSLAHVG
ncbi:MAG: DNA (cytosine-5-)-methyltransferase [Defluviicoccus sp.]|nr:DNA (cytosine-5-)-methyltransferase [Defluviicoccus sp.]